MLKTKIIIALSLSAALFSRFTANTIVRVETQPRVTSHKGLAMNHQLKPLADTMLLKVGDKCPDIVFRDTSGYDGHDVKLNEFKGKYVVIDVWASWCAPCRVQYPHLVLLAEKMKNKAISFVSISLDTRIWRWKGPMLTQMGGIQWMVRDSTFEKAFGINTIPRFILLDKNGIVLDLNLPMPSHPELEEELNKLTGI